MIRPATYDDLPNWYESALSFHQRTIYAELPTSQVAITSMFGHSVSSALGFVWVEIDDGGNVCGSLIGTCQPLWWSSRRYATDLAFWFTSPWAGVRMAREFLSWAKDRGASEVTMGVSAGIGNLDPLFRRIGLERVGGLYTRVL